MSTNTEIPTPRTDNPPIPTPRTDEAFRRYRLTPWNYTKRELHGDMAEMERKLQKARDTLAAVNASTVLPGEIHAAITETLKTTAP